MAQLSKTLRSMQGGQLAFFCPGCQEIHTINVGEGAGPRWNYNGNADSPTFTPSILVRSGHFVPGHENGPCWCTFAKEDNESVEEPFTCKQCHSFVTDGKIQFLGDCSHKLAGQTIDLPDIGEKDV